MLNEQAGSVTLEQEPGILERMIGWFREHGIEAQVETVTPDLLADTVRQAAAGKWDALIAGGGDGTVSLLAGNLAGKNIPLGVLPLGTYNHFARDLNLPLELEEAIRSIAESKPRAVDLAEVNQHFFVNNSSIGIYPRAVAERETLRRQTGGGKRLLMVWAGIKVLMRRPLVRVRLEMEGKVIERTTPFVFVGNNCYTLGLREDKLRACLDEGCLSVFAARDIGIWGLGRLAWHALRNRLRSSDELDSWRTAELRIHTRKQRVRVALDGEVMHLLSPLCYRIHPRALQVLAPA